MLRVVLDVNVLVSALIIRGKPRELWLKGVRKEFGLVSSAQILADFIQVIGRAKFQPYVKSRDLQDFLKAFHAKVSFVDVKSRFKVVKTDPDDDIPLRTAFDGKAHYIVSGDKHLLALKEFKGTKIVTVDEMLQILKTTVSRKRKTGG